jgi:SAM-dependent methyltransferase
MAYFKNVELAEKYHISEGAVRNWIKEAGRGKLQFKLHTENGITHIADTAGNLVIIERLVSERKKYRNTRAYKIASPSPDFYKLFNRKQILDIISELTIHREIPRQYNYFDGGAVNWEKFVEHMRSEDAPNLLKSTVELLHANLGTLDLLLNGYERVNVIDIGPGNALPVKELLEHLLDRGILHRYIAIDISEEMLHIARRNIEEWFGSKVAFEGYVRDIAYERFDDVLVDDMLDEKADKTVNLALLLGATPMNFRAPYDILKPIYGSLGSNDLLMYTDKPDTEAERRSFAVNDTSFDQRAKALSPKYSFILDLLNIDESIYDVEMGFNEHKRMKYICFRLKVGLILKFSFKNGERTVEFNKGDAILVWRVWCQTAVEIIGGFAEIGFTLIDANMTKDRQYLLTISGVDSNGSG